MNKIIIMISLYPAFISENGLQLSRMLKVYLKTKTKNITIFKPNFEI